MFTNNRLLRPSALLALSTLTIGLMFTSPTSAQVRIEVPDLEIPALPELRGMGAIMDMTVTGGTNRSMSMTVENGVTKLTVTENGEKTMIETDQDGAITMRVTKKYTRDNMDALMDEHPTLYMSVKGFPEEDEGSEVDFTLRVTKKYVADSADELKENHPEIFKIYEKYQSSTQNGGIRFDTELAPMLRELRGGIRVMPRGGLRGGRILRDIRIHEDEGADEDASEQEESSEEKPKDKDA